MIFLYKIKPVHVQSKCHYTAADREAQVTRNGIHEWRKTEQRE